jgi:hypothetical protein
MNESTEQAIQKVNTSFYNAFESLSVKRMEEDWKHSDDVVWSIPVGICLLAKLSLQLFVANYLSSLP